MKRTDLLKAMATLPFLGSLFASPLATTEETAVAMGEPEMLGTTFVQLTRGGMMLWSNTRPGWPSLYEIEDAAAHGFDRFEIVSNIRGVIYQAPTLEGQLPVGWTSLEYAGFLQPGEIPQGVPSWIR